MLDRVVGYLNEMEVPRSIVELMVATSSSDIRWVNPDLTEGLDRPPSIAEWVDASCGRDDHFHEALRQDPKLRQSLKDGVRSPQLDDLLDKFFKKLNCQMALFEKYRKTGDASGLRATTRRWLSIP
jgi:hypothetical protein